MIARAVIVRELGAERLLVPALLEEAHRAGRQARGCVTLLRQARAFADAPGGATAVGEDGMPGLPEDTVAFAAIAAGSEKCGPHRYHIPHLGDITAALVRAVEAMIRPLAGDEAETFRRRLDELAQPPSDDDVLGQEDLERIVSMDRSGNDSLCQLTADVDAALDRARREIAAEKVAGACGYALGPADRPLVEAFMAGVARTAMLKFDHPGLATTAMAMGGTLVIENDITATDAHVLVVTLEGLGARIAYTDVHCGRLAFFRRMLAETRVAWSPTREWRDGHGGEGYALATATIEAADRDELRDVLDETGSRLAFLVGWKRARKQLRPFLAKDDTQALLEWAAAENVGHCGFLAVGGSRAVFKAIEVAAAGRLHLGDRLSDVLGREQTVDYLRFVLRTAAQGLLAGRSVAAIQADLEAELCACFGSCEGWVGVARGRAQRLHEIASALATTPGNGIDRTAPVAADGELEPAVVRGELAEVMEQAAAGLVAAARSLRDRAASQRSNSGTPLAT